ncbi:hypothetical protein BBJ28_00018359 [Nothophytophthora sp. Chile5]|nr:hypothetical protein BBJ28_00018359 [Nothophytophthora sp. Chile5]
MAGATTKRWARSTVPLLLLLLLCAATQLSCADVRGERELATLDAEFMTRFKETAGEQEALARRLQNSRLLVREMFANEQEEQLLYMQETRFKMDSIRDVVREEVRSATEDVRAMLASAASNVTMWRKRREELRAATEKKRDMLELIRRHKEAEQHRKEQSGPDDDSAEGDEGQTEEQQLEGEEGEGLLPKLSRWYDSVADAILAAVKLVSRQLVLPVAVILGFFLLATVIIARYNAVQQARRKKRILYSSYPKSYRPHSGPKQKQTRVDASRQNPLTGD